MSSFYTLAGTVQSLNSVYISRAADSQLFDLCQKSIFAYVLSARQMGKSSLVAHTQRRLEEKGVVTAHIDLSSLGSPSRAEAWFDGLMMSIHLDLELKTDLDEWLTAHQRMTVVQRMIEWFREVVIVEKVSPIVIFIDEIDFTISMPYSDDFFAAIRALYLQRNKTPDLNRLTFVMVGSASPLDLIKDQSRTPLNIGQAVELTDFTLEEAQPFKKGLNLPDRMANDALRAIIRWTNGHPYLTQRLCIAVSETDHVAWNLRQVDEIVQDIFFSQKTGEDNNLRYVDEKVLRGFPSDITLSEVLDVYKDIRLSRRRVIDNEKSDLVHAHLKLAGIVKTHMRERHLVVRNRIYETAFDARWINRHIPSSPQPELPEPEAKADPTPQSNLFARVYNQLGRFYLNYILRRPSRFAQRIEIIEFPVEGFAPQIPGLNVMQKPFAIGGTAGLFFATPLPETSGLPDQLIVKIGVEPRFISLLEREADVLIHCSLPNLRQIFPIVGSQDKFVDWTSGESNKLPYILLEYIPGQTLEIYSLEHTLSLSKAVTILRPIAQTLDHLHLLGYVHYDVNPRNIIISANSPSRLIDLSLAETIGKSPETRAETLFYSPPERSKAFVVEASQDIYSFGVIVVSIIMRLVGERFSTPPTNFGKTPAPSYNNGDTSDPLSSQLPGFNLAEVPAKTREFIELLTRTESDQRPVSASAVLDLLLDYQEVIDVEIQQLQFNRLLGRLLEMRKPAARSGFILNLVVFGVTTVLFLLGFIWWILNVAIVGVITAVHQQMLIITSKNQIFTAFFGLFVAGSITGGLAWVLRGKRIAPLQAMRMMTNFNQVQNQPTEIVAPIDTSPSWPAPITNVYGSPPAKPKGPFLLGRLIVKSGLENIKYIDINQEEFTIGREKRVGVDYHINYPALSGLHFTIKYAQQQFTIRDLQTANGTRVNGSALNAFEIRSLYHGDEIEVGNDLKLVFGKFSLNEVETGIMFSDAPLFYPVLSFIYPTFSNTMYAQLEVISGIHDAEFLPIFPNISRSIRIGRNIESPMEGDIQLSSPFLSNTHIIIFLGNDMLQIEEPYPSARNGYKLSNKSGEQINISRFSTALQDEDIIWLPQNIQLRVKLDPFWFDVETGLAKVPESNDAPASPQYNEPSPSYRPEPENDSFFDDDIDHSDSEQNLSSDTNFPLRAYANARLIVRDKNKVEVSHQLLKGQNRMGRNQSNDIVLVGDPSVSRRHGMIWETSGTYVLHNYSSHNPIYYNEIPMLQGQTHILRHGDTLTLGRTLMVFSVVES